MLGALSMNHRSLHCGVAISFVLDSLLRHGSVETDAARIPARLPAFAHSFDEFIREQILNILWKDETDQLPAPL
jgi:hypothetical protein